MNKIFKVIFNRQTGTFQAVQETAKGQHKTQSSQGNKTKTAKIVKAVLRPLTIAMTLLASSIAMASPTGGQVTAGQATINQNGLTTNINQSSQNAAINWQSFNIAKNETVNFNQPNAQSVTLNRVIGNEKSVIDGAMNANGKVFISNANGMLIGKDAKINVGSLVATTANISDDDVVNGRYQFTGEGVGKIENLGHISVPKGGVVALVAPIVKNGGTITAHEGNVLLASAESFSITLPDKANFAYTLDKGTLQGLVDNGGAILADAGRVVLTAKGVDTVKKSLIKHSGKIEANTVSNNNGVIELLGDLDNSALNVSGSLKAEAKASGDGGFIETSASQVKIEDSAEVSTLAENGKTGTWLIDPKDFTVAPSGGDITGAKVSEGLQSNNVTLKSRDGAKEGKGDVIINDEISWDRNTLTLNAENDIHINKTLNGTGTAKLALEYGQGTSDGWEGDYHIKRGVKVNLPVGKVFTTQQGNTGEKIVFDVIHEMPKIVKNTNGEWESVFTTRNIAFGKDIDVGFTKNYEGFAGWQLPLIADGSRVVNGIDVRWGRIYGLGHSISNVHINTKSNQSGFVTDLNYGNIHDLTLNTINIFGKNNVGGVIGDSHANVLKNISINQANVKGDENVGGMIGIGLANTINNVSINGNVTGNMSVGGVIGYSSNNTVSGGQILTNVTGNSEVGGIIGTSVSSSIRDSYVTGSIKEGQKPNRPKNIYLGGLIGSVDSQDNYFSSTYIQNSYFSGRIDTTENSNAVGSIVGGNVSPNVALHTNNVFFNVDKSNLDEGGAVLGEEHGIPKTESELKQKSTFAGWDETIWNIQDGKLPTLRHTENTVTSPTVPPVTPPVVNVDFEPAKKSLADTKTYRQNMLNRMVIFAKNGEFTKLNIDQINDNIRKEIAKTQALIDALPDGAEKTNLQNQLNAITVLTRDEIQNAEKISNDVAKEKQKEQQRKEQAEKDKKDAYEAVSNLEKSRQAILDNYYNQAKQGKLLDSGSINQTLSQAWLNAKNKVNKVTEQSEQTNLNNRLSVLGVLTQAEIDRAKAFVKAYQDNQARLEEEKKRAEEARRKAEEEKRKAEQQAKEQERIQALFKDAQNLVQQAKEFADRSQSLVDNGRTNDVVTLNKNLTERKQQAQASIDKLPNNATKTLLQRQLNEIALIKANGSVNNPQVKPVEKPNTEQEKTDKERKHILQINHDVVTEQINKKPEKPVELQKAEDNREVEVIRVANHQDTSTFKSVFNFFYENVGQGGNYVKTDEKGNIVLTNGHAFPVEAVLTMPNGEKKVFILPPRDKGIINWANDTVLKFDVVDFSTHFNGTPTFGSNISKTNIPINQMIENGVSGHITFYTNTPQTRDMTKLYVALDIASLIVEKVIDKIDVDANKQLNVDGKELIKELATDKEFYNLAITTITDNSLGYKEKGEKIADYAKTFFQKNLLKYANTGLQRTAGVDKAIEYATSDLQNLAFVEKLGDTLLKLNSELAFSKKQDYILLTTDAFVEK